MIWTIFWIVEIALVLWALFDLIMGDRKTFKAFASYGLLFWLLLILIIPVFGSIIYAIVEDRMFMKWVR
jgi:hypothetical protein